MTGMFSIHFDGLRLVISLFLLTKCILLICELIFVLLWKLKNELIDKLKDEHLIFAHKPHDGVKTKIYPYDSSIPIDSVTYYLVPNER